MKTYVKRDWIIFFRYTFMTMHVCLDRSFRINEIYVLRILIYCDDWVHSRWRQSGDMRSFEVHVFLSILHSRYKSVYLLERERSWRESLFTTEYVKTPFTIFDGTRDCCRVFVLKCHFVINPFVIRHTIFAFPTTFQQFPLLL